MSAFRMGVAAAKLKYPNPFSKNIIEHNQWNAGLTKGLRNMKVNMKNKKIREGVAFLIEDQFEKANVVVAAQAISETLQTMAENLGKIEPNDLMPMYDSLRTALGAQTADRFSKSVTEQVRGLMDAVKAARNVVDGEIDNLSAIANGEPGNDMNMDAEADPAMMDEPKATGPADDDVFPDDAEHLEDELPDEKQSNAAGRLRKESRSRSKANALKESRNGIILGAFRRALSATNGKVLESVTCVASIYEIDASEVVSIVKEAKGKRPFDQRGKVSEAKRKLSYRSKWNPDTMWFDIVDANDRIVAKDVAVNGGTAQRIASSYRPGQIMERRHRLSEDMPVKPKTPQEMRDDQKAEQANKANVAANPKATPVPNTATPKPPVANPTATPKPPVAGQPNDAMKNAIDPKKDGIAMPGKVMNTPPKVAPNMNGNMNGKKDMLATEDSETIVTKEKKPKGEPSLVQANSSTPTLFSKTKPLPSPGHKLMDSKSDPAKKDDPCWDDYKMVGMKKKNGKTVPNCVKK